MGKKYRFKKSKRKSEWKKRIDPFYFSEEWLELRVRVLSYWGPKCMVCGRTRKDGVQINVDHIRARRLWPALALDFNNMGVLCGRHNKEKGGKYWGDYRPQDKVAAIPQDLLYPKSGVSVYDLDDSEASHMRAII